MGLKRSFVFFVTLLLFCLSLLCYYYYSGGPEESVENLIKGLYYIGPIFRVLVK